MFGSGIIAHISVGQLDLHTLSVCLTRAMFRRCLRLRNCSILLGLCWDIQDRADQDGRENRGMRRTECVTINETFKPREIASIATDFSMPEILHPHPSNHNPDPSHDRREYYQSWIVSYNWQCRIILQLRRSIGSFTHIPRPAPHT